MANTKVTTKGSGKSVDVLVDGDVIHTAVSKDAATGFAQWLEFQLNSGASVADLRRMLKGEAPKNTDGYTGGANAVAGESGGGGGRARKAAKKKVDFSFLDGRITKVKAAIESGKYDEVLDELLEEEESGRNRVTAVRAIKARMEEAG